MSAGTRGLCVPLTVSPHAVPLKPAQSVFSDSLLSKHGKLEDLALRHKLARTCRSEVIRNLQRSFSELTVERINHISQHLHI